MLALENSFNPNSLLQYFEWIMNRIFIFIISLICFQIVDSKAINNITPRISTERGHSRQIYRSTDEANNLNDSNLKQVKKKRLRRFFNYFKIVINYEKYRSDDGSILFVPVDSNRNHYFIG